MHKSLSLAAALCLVAAAATAQGQKPLSPPAKAEASIAGKKLTVDYNAPSKRGRVIMGELVPYGKVWRTGANSATTLSTEADLTIGGLNVPAGTYTLFTIPGEKEWTLIVNKQTGQWGTRYDQSQDLGRVKMTVNPVKETVETFVIDIKPGSGNEGVLRMRWENTEASVPLMVR
ncbi:MAG TPA: DUF2911 domain-containing protein [Thermoanaerobaculia bacterium]|nr:DUF2911 domain-containing protein [Thermoanaerobaculia bacterium]